LYRSGNHAEGGNVKANITRYTLLVAVTSAFVMVAMAPYMVGA